jgi:hypothetical protein
MHEALPLEGERKRGTMPRESPCEGVLVTLKGTTPSDLEVPWDPGGDENIEHEVDAPPQERHAVWCHGVCIADRAMSCRGACGGAMRLCGTQVNLKSNPEESVRPHHHDKASTHLCLYPPYSNNNCAMSGRY